MGWFKYLMVYTFGFLMGVSVIYFKAPECVEQTIIVEARVQELTKFIKASNRTVSDKTAREYAKYYLDAEKESDVNALLLATMGKFESNHNPGLMSTMGAIGMQQIMPVYWVGVVPFINSAHELFDPRLNIRASAWIVSHYREICGVSVAAIATCYHGGPGALSRPQQSTITYAMQVVSTFNGTARPSVFAPSF